MKQIMMISKDKNHNFMKEVLSYDDNDTEIEETEDYSAEDFIREQVEKSATARGQQKNISFFAFTATPKYKTLAISSKKDIEGNPQPFHLYSMRQAIEEGFILDVLENYTNYELYFNGC